MQMFLFIMRSGARVHVQLSDGCESPIEKFLQFGDNLFMQFDKELVIRIQEIAVIEKVKND